MKNAFLKSLAAASLAVIMALGTAIGPVPQMAQVKAESVVNTGSDLRGVWVSYMDYAALGMANVTKAQYKANVKKFLTSAKRIGLNAVFLQVRSYDDAIWESETFPASPYLSKKAKADVSAEDTYTYDPLEEFITVANTKNMEVHAWMNPYRISRDYYLDPGVAGSRKRVLKAVDEVMEYEVDGIHFDDYFYHAPKGYVKEARRNAPYQVSLTSTDRCKRVNQLVKAVYAAVHDANEDAVFGISPQANIPNDMNAGADVYTWLREDGYIDYLVPQIYWTDNYGSGGRVKMFTDRLNQFMGLKKNKAKMYAGLALYHAGTSVASDPGWGMRTNNLATQASLVKARGGNGYILFSARFLSAPHTAAERGNLFR